MTTVGDTQPLPWDAEMDRDLGLDVSDLPEERRVMQRGADRTAQVQHEEDITEMVSKACKILDLKAKPPNLDKEQDWQEFKFKMKILAGTVGIESEMDEAAATVSDVSEKRLTDKQRVMSRVLYLLLMENCPLGFSCLRVLPRGEGFRAWQELCRKFEPRHPGRYAQQLTDLLNPSWATTAGSFMDKLRRWQV